MDNTCLYAVVFFLFFILTDCKISRQEVLRTLLSNSSYDETIAPDFEQDHATKVTVQLKIANVHSVSEITMDYSMDVILRQTWRDERLSFQKISNETSLELDQKLMNNVWVPDTYFSNEKKGTFHDITVPNKLMHLFRNGTIVYSLRLALTLSCEMELRKYPLDSQICPITIESYGYTTDNLVFEWRKYEAIKFEKMELAQYTLSSEYQMLPCFRHSNTTGEFACLQANLFLKRNRGYYIIQIFIPSVLIVTLSWVSFWLDLDAIPARISLGVLTVLTMTTQSSGARASLPKVSYIKAIDVWMSVCLIFVFASLLEFAYVNVQTRKRNVDVGKETKSFLWKCSGEMDSRTRARRVDKLSRLMFPLSFLLFQLVFWLYYLYS